MVRHTAVYVSLELHRGIPKKIIQSRTGQKIIEALKVYKETDNE